MPKTKKVVTVIFIGGPHDGHTMLQEEPLNYIIVFPVQSEFKYFAPTDNIESDIATLREKYDYYDLQPVTYHYHYKGRR